MYESLFLCLRLFDKEEDFFLILYGDRLLLIHSNDGL